MRALFTLLLALSLWPATALALPVIDKPVTDLARVFTDSEVQAMSAQLVAHHEATGVQMAVLTVDTKGRQPIEDYALAVANKWGGGSRERNDGVLLVLAINDRESRLEVGRGLEATISDLVAGRILAASTEHLRRAHYATAAQGIISSVIARTAHIKAGGPLDKRPFKSRLEWVLPLFVGLGMLAGFTCVRSVRREPLASEPLPVNNTIRLVHSARVLPTVLASGPAPILIALLLAEGTLFWLAWPIIWLGAVGVGASVAVLYREQASDGIIAALSVLIVFAIAPQAAGPDYFYSGLDLLRVALMSLSFGFALWLMLGTIWFKITGQGCEVFSSSGSSGSSASGSSRSSRSSRSSYSGGGGSFGGGGASGRW